MTKKIVYTDLDGTLTLKDTYTTLLIKQMTFKNIFFNLNKLLKSYILYLFNIYTQDDIKRITFKIFFENKNIISLENDINNLIQNIKINSVVLKKIKSLQNNGFKIIIVTASPDFYVKHVCKYFKFDDFIASKTYINNNILTGYFDGKICNFDEKVKRIKNNNNFSVESYKISFGNSNGDLTMLNFCDEAYWVKNSDLIQIKSI